MQVFIHYGAHSNTSLLVEYGFIIPANPDDGIPLTLEQLLGASSLSTSSSTLQKLKDASLHLGIAISPNSGLTLRVSSYKDKVLKKIQFYGRLPLLGLSWSGLASLRIMSSKLEELDDLTWVYEEDLDHLPQAKDTIKGVMKETQTSLKALRCLLDLERVAENSPERLSEQLSCQGCLELLQEHHRILEKLLIDIG